MSMRKRRKAARAQVVGGGRAAGPFPHPFFDGTMKRLRWAVKCSSWTPSKEEWIKVMNLIQEEEAQRIDQFVFPRNAKFALIGRVMIRAALTQLLPHLKTFTLKRSERGKPFLAREDGSEDQYVHFNISHQGDYVVLATEEEKLGVDVMQLSSPRNTSLGDFFHLMRRKFTALEWQQIAPSGSLQSQQLKNFYRFWTLKESFIKAEGSGLSYGLHNLEFSTCFEWPPPAGVVCVDSKLKISGVLAQGWTFEESLMTDDHCVCVAVCNQEQFNLPLPFDLYTMQQLLGKLPGQDGSRTS